MKTQRAKRSASRFCRRDLLRDTPIDVTGEQALEPCLRQFHFRDVAEGLVLDIAPRLTPACRECDFSFQAQTKRINEVRDQCFHPNEVTTQAGGTLRERRGAPGVGRSPTPGAPRLSR